MTNQALVTAYFAGWINRDADAILATLGEDGTYEDPTTGQPIGGDAFRAYLAALWAAFPDLSFEIVSEAETGPDTVAAQWIMHGTNSGSMNGLPPTGRKIELHGSDFFRIEGDQIATVLGYFDTAVIPRQLGLDVIVQPSEAGPFRFGTATAVSSGKRDEPGAYSITFLDALDEEAAGKVREGSRASLMDMLEMEGFIGAATLKLGSRMVTVSAWEDADAPRRVMSEGAHSTAMRGLMDGTLASSGYTTVWSLERNNGFWVRCTSCGKMKRNAKDGDICGCGGVLPQHPPYW